jgi:acetylornithine deacetylase/succinyl-diaminopimelate desuccinylase-like protein
MYGGAALNAIHVLLRLFQSVLAGPDGRLPEPLRQGITPPTAEELAGWATLPPGSDELRDQGARALDPTAAQEFYTRTWAEPSADVNGIIGGKPGLRNTTLSVQSSGEFTIRLAPGQDVDTIGAAAEKILREAAPDGADVEIDWSGSPPSLLRPDAPAIQLGLQAFENVLGVRPLFVRSGGTLPIMRALADKGIATILTGFGLPESNVHSPNEKFLVRYFEQGVDTAAELYTEFGKLPTT